MSQQRNDSYVLSAWAGPSMASPKHGYDYLVSNRQLTRNAVRKLVHEALVRQGFNPHTSPTLIQSWLKLNRQYKQGGELQ